MNTDNQNNQDEQYKVTSPNQLIEDIKSDTSLRPNSFKNFVYSQLGSLPTSKLYKSFSSSVTGASPIDQGKAVSSI